MGGCVVKAHDIFSTCLANMREVFDYTPPYNQVVLTGIVACSAIASTSPGS